MTEQGAAVLASSAAMSETIPPSLAMLVLGSVAPISIGTLFIAGLLPAAVIASLLMVLNYLLSRRGNMASVPRATAAELLRRDLAFVLRHAWQPCFDIWEEERGLHAYTLRVSAAALAEGADWLDRSGEAATAKLCRAEARLLDIALEDFWMTEKKHLRSRYVEGGAPEKLLDMSVILAANHARVLGEPYRLTLAHLENLFGDAYAINRDRPTSRAPALGRYEGDRYYSGGAYYFSTLAAAEFYYRNGDLAKGDAFLETVRAFTPENGDLSEQFDQNNGAQTSARHLAWSYAAFLTAVASRRMMAV